MKDKIDLFPFFWFCGLIGMAVAQHFPGGLGAGGGFIVGVVAAFLIIVLFLWEAYKIVLRRYLRQEVKQLPSPEIVTIDLKMWSDPGWDRIREFCEAERQRKISKPV